MKLAHLSFRSQTNLDGFRNYLSFNLTGCPFFASIGLWLLVVQAFQAKIHQFPIQIPANTETRSHRFKRPLTVVSVDSMLCQEAGWDKHLDSMDFWRRWAMNHLEVPNLA